MLIAKFISLYHTSHFAVAKKLLLSYKHDVPFNVYLKLYFRQNKKHGSKDRRSITSLCYNYFRLGKSFTNVTVEERILSGTFLCEKTPSEIFRFYKPEWNDVIERSLNEKIAILKSQFSIEDIFPFHDELSKGIDAKNFSFSFLHQPKLFIRIRPGFEKTVLQKLEINNIKCEVISKNCIAFSNSSKIDTVIDLDRQAVVQDYNSQRVGEYLKLVIENKKSEIDVWDCCAASGGKSILAYDINPSIKLIVSDKRKSILQNLEERFAKAGIKNYTSFVADLSSPHPLEKVARRFDFIIADVPCTGSGTWSRTPEQLFYFDEKELKKYSDLQKNIVQNVTPYLKPGGHLVYITCSVFKKENEEVVNFVRERLKLTLIEMQLLKGCEIKADTMFVALFTLN